MSLMDNIKQYIKIWYITYLLAITSWLITINTTYITNIASNDFLGILSKLPIYFYISIVLTILSMKQAYQHDDLLIVALGLFALVIILYLTYPMVQSNASYSVTYYPSGMVKQILEKEHMSTKFNYKGYIYLYYPSFQIFATMLVSMSNLDLDFIIKYFHVLFVFIMAISMILAYQILSKNWKLSLIGCTFFVVFLWSEQVYFGPQLFAFTLISLLFTILIKYIRNRSSSLIVMMILTFLVINSSHVLTSLMAVLFFFLLYLMMLSTNVKVMQIRFKYLFMSFLVIFSAWLVYVASHFFKYSVKELLRVSSSETYIKSVTLQRSLFGESLNESIIFNVRVLFIILNLILAAIAIFYYIKDKNRDSNYSIAIVWLLGTLPLVSTVYGGEIIQRMYLFSLIGTAFLIAYLFLAINRKGNRTGIMFFILLILTLLNPIGFAGDSVLKFVSDSELRGNTYFSKEAAQNIKAFYIGGGPILKYIDPYDKRDISGIWFPPRKKNINLTKFEYVIHSEIGTNGLYYYMSRDMLREEIEKSDSGLYLIYDNQKYQIYKKLREIKV